MPTSHNTILLALGTAVVTAAQLAAAQERGTFDLSAFASYTSFAASYDMKSAIGYGGRAAAFLSSRIAVEGEVNVGTAARTTALSDRSFRFIDGRVLYVPLTSGRVSILLGAGGGRIDADQGLADDEHAYGTHALAGGRFALGDRAALRIDYTRYFHGAAQHGSLKAGLSFYPLKS